MDITYIGHSGFLLEWENCYWLFDYYNGVIPELDNTKKLFVFVSHKHGDHFNPEIFHLSKKYRDILFIVSSDINLRNKSLLLMDSFINVSDKIITVRPSNQYVLLDNDNKLIVLDTLKSTDCGVAFILQYQGKTIYHAGDLNLWIWKCETKQCNNDMSARFQKEMSYLKDKPIDIAFAPLDPRQEEDYYQGLESLLDIAKVKYVFPMHFWEKPSIIQQFKRERPRRDAAIIMEISSNGQQWTIDL